LCINDFKHHFIIYQGLILQNRTIIVAKNSSKKNKHQILHKNSKELDAKTEKKKEKKR